MAMLSCSPVMAVLVAARAELTAVSESCVLAASAFNAKADVRSELFTKGAVALMTSAFEAKGDTVEDKRA